MKTTVYVITDARRPLAQRARDLILAVTAWALLAIAVLGYTLILLAGAVDALVAAVFGTRRLGYISEQLAAAVWKTWKEDK